MKKIFSIIICVLFLSGCSYSEGISSNYDSVTKTVQNATFELPKNWSEKTYDNNEFVYYYTPSNDFLMVSVSPCQFTIDEALFLSVIEGYSQNTENFNILENGYKEIAEKSLYYAKTSSVISETDIVSEIYLISHQGNLYSFNMVCKGNEYKYAETMSNMLQSLKFEQNIDSSFKTETFTKKLFSDLENVFKSSSPDIETSFDITEIANTVSKDNMSTIATYLITYKTSLLETVSAEETYHLSITSSNHSDNITNISIFTEKQNYIYFSIIVNNIVLNLDNSIDIDAFERKYRLLSQETEFLTDEEAKFNIIKNVTDDFISVSLTLL